MAKIELDYMEYSSDANAQAAYVTNGGGLTNEVPTNAGFETWTAGDSSAPDGYTLTGTDATIAKESSIVKAGSFSAKLTRVGNNCILYQDMSSARGINYFKGKVVTVGAWLYATVASRVRIDINDGDINVASAYHTGGSTWEWVTKSYTVSSVASFMRMGLNVKGGDTSGYIDGIIVVEGYAAGSGDLCRLQSYSESTIKTQGSYSLKGIAAITDSLNKTLTRTIT